VAAASWHSAAGSAAAQPATPPEPPPIWDFQLGGSVVGTTGNSDTSSLGAALDGHRRWTLWSIEGMASVVRTSQDGELTAEQYIGAFRAKRALTERVALTSGIKLERDPLAGLDVRSLLDAGLVYALVRRPQWTLDGLTTVAWSHEDRVTDEVLDEAQGILELVSKYLFSAGESMQRYRFYPDFTNSEGYRSEAEVTLQAAVNRRFALKFGFLWRYAHDPVPGFKRNDTTTTASIVVRWRKDAPPGR
jgi:putative salt-induced outer membrane protein YdiY